MIEAAILGLGRWGRRLVDSVQADGAPLGGRIRFRHGGTRTLTDDVRAYAARQQLRLRSEAEILMDPAIDAVVLATPHSQHAAQIEAAARARKHVFVEKPLALTREEALRAVAACRAAGVVLAVGHNRRFLPAFAALLAELRAGALGHVLHVEANFSGPFGFDYRPGMWRASAAESPGGGLTPMGVHMLDLMIALCGPVESVMAESARQVLQVDLDDTTAALLRFRSGVRGYLGTLTATPRIWRLHVMGTQGWVQLLDQHLVERCSRDGQRRTETLAVVDIERAELEEFAAACDGAATYRVPAEDVVHGVAVMEAMFRSIAADGARRAVEG